MRDDEFPEQSETSDHTFIARSSRPEDFVRIRPEEDKEDDGS